ncbi:aldo/keto reductase [Stakelama sp. CBK3Z-3]|uniref:Aldo/keto reductase n=2 Tax=Stakelama flava TaxID=2860338 RepID=A0ABS6XL15_9SPHN|nr:aldo/keto reductase [Stakelama flava]MBW4330902.1 aldo/keto reductase [Stakelama flava]
MQYVKLGNSGLDVSPVCIGCMGFGNPARGHPAWSINEEASRALIRHALEAGINFFDTANMYSTGTSEEFVGRALKAFVARDAVVIATKVSGAMRNGPNAIGLSRKAILAEVDHSLRRLGTDYIDLYQIHRRDQLTPWEETLEALNDVVKAGKVRYIGASSMKAWEFAKALNVQKANGWTRFISMQHNYNLVAREEEREMIPLCADEGVATMIYSPLARGKLARPWGTTTKRTETEPAGAAQNPATENSDHAIVDAVNAIAAERGVSAAEISLAWLHRNPVVAAPIVGALKAKHIDDAVAALTITLTDDEARRLEEPYTPRDDFQSISTPALLHRSIEESTGFKANAALV